MLKKFTFLLCLSGISVNIALAGQPGNETVAPTGVNLVAPTTVGTWTIGATLLYVQPNDNFQYIQAVLPQDDGSTLYHNESEDTDHDYGWDANISYLFPNTGRDVSVDFGHVSMSDSEGYGTDDAITLNGIGHVITLTGPTEVMGYANYNITHADLTFGQLVQIGQRVQLHPYAGLQYARTEMEGNANYPNGDTGELTKFSSDSVFNGIGPRAGMDFKVKLGWGFAIAGNAGGALLAGDRNDPYKITTNAQDPDLTETQKYKTADDFTVIPELDMRLGLDYSYAFTPSTSFDIQGGVMVVNYFNADQHDFLDTYNVNTTVAENEIGYHGPYLHLSVSFA